MPRSCPPQKTGHLRSNSGWPGLTSPCPPPPQVAATTPLTFPCISIRSVRVMLSSGSSSSPASELLILSGGAGATAAWKCVHAVAWLALARGAGEVLSQEPSSLSGPLTFYGDPRAGLAKLPENGDDAGRDWGACGQLASCATLDSSLNPSEPRSPHLEEGETKSYPQRVMRIKMS